MAIGVAEVSGCSYTIHMLNEPTPRVHVILSTIHVTTYCLLPWICIHMSIAMDMFPGTTCYHELYMSLPCLLP